ncbi:MAG: hypothetical protein ACFB0C_14745 [Leptolyngbyaceae cyanobacterium]|mgnify:CR=1 FL=1
MTATSLILTNQYRSFGGWQQVYRHAALTLGCEIPLGVYFPPKRNLNLAQ